MYEELQELFVGKQIIITPGEEDENLVGICDGITEVPNFNNRFLFDIKDGKKYGITVSSKSPGRVVGLYKEGSGEFRTISVL